MRPGIAAGFGYAGIVPWQLARRGRVLSKAGRASEESRLGLGFCQKGPYLVPRCVNCRTVSSPPRKRGSSGAFEALALDARFRGHDEKPPVTYANCCKEVPVFRLSFGSVAWRHVDE